MRHMIGSRSRPNVMLSSEGVAAALYRVEQKADGKLHGNEVGILAF